MKVSRPIIIGVAILILLAGISPPSGGTGSAPTHGLNPIKLSAHDVVNGSTLWLEINTDHFGEPISAVQVHFQDHFIPLARHPLKSHNTYFGLVAIPLPSKPGRTYLSVEWSSSKGSHTKQIPFTVVAGRYRTDTLTVDSRRVSLNKKDLSRVKRERKEIARVWEAAHVERLWESVFQLPIQSEVTSSFGNKRMFNDQLQSFHRGTDFRAAVGKPVLTANSGVVKLAKELFYSGRIVIVDHGTGIFSTYAHLSRIDVKPDQRVTKSQLIGLSGATGRVNGPHLHWGIKVNHTYVDPLQFVRVISSLMSN